MDDQTALLHGLLSAVVDLAELPHPHPGPVGRVMLAASVAGRGCSDGAIARTASMPVTDVREVIPSMLDRCGHTPALLTAKVTRTPLGTTYTGIRLTGEATRRLQKLRDYLIRV
ncbi:hypothetical protein [Lichenibacterium ramalinae]|uniref:Uncharacterized protein n=1 Tax=Lichenibacterium ramalinae TaxID=2316527 RepID=A0A4V1RHW3_9HYPH|nr:hypothetical protein [Lichenibacterium ramalinae]RYB01447.1 hypothetical protein D3272_26100 [Lichenibacterium ramalinae]